MLLKMAPDLTEGMFRRGGETLIAGAAKQAGKN